MAKGLLPGWAVLILSGGICLLGCEQSSVKEVQRHPAAMRESPELVAKREQAEREWVAQEQVRRRAWVEETVAPYRNSDPNGPPQLQQDPQPGAPDAAVTSEKWPTAFKRRCYQLGITMSQFKAIRHPDQKEWPNAFPVLSNEDRAAGLGFLAAEIYGSWKKAEVIKAHYFYRDTLVGSGYTTISDAGLMLGRVPADTNFYFYPDEEGGTPVLFYIKSSGPSDEFAYLAGLYREALGEPTAVREEPVQNRMGAAFTNEVIEYANEVSMVRISRFSETLDVLEVRYVLIPVMGRLIERLEAIERDEASRL